MSHTGIDFEIEWRSIKELLALELEVSDTLRRSAVIALAHLVQRSPC